MTLEEALATDVAQAVVERLRRQELRPDGLLLYSPDQVSKAVVETVCAIPFAKLAEALERWLRENRVGS